MVLLGSTVIPIGVHVQAVSREVLLLTLFNNSLKITLGIEEPVFMKDFQQEVPVKSKVKI
jgi:hypothetical protein